MCVWLIKTILLFSYWSG